MQLHALRDFVYAILFGTLPWLAWQGWCVVALVALLVTEIILTLWDFVVEDLVRKQLGGVYPGERVMHGVMGIVYGAVIACLVPTLVTWWPKPTGLAISAPAVSIILRWTLTIMAVGVLLSGLRGFAIYDAPFRSPAQILHVQGTELRNPDNVALSPDGHHLAVLGYPDPILEIFDLSAGR